MPEFRLPTKPPARAALTCTRFGGDPGPGLQPPSGKPSPALGPPPGARPMIRWRKGATRLIDTWNEPQSRRRTDDRSCARRAVEGSIVRPAAGRGMLTCPRSIGPATLPVMEPGPLVGVPLVPASNTHSRSSCRLSKISIADEMGIGSTRRVQVSLRWGSLQLGRKIPGEQF
jgi:hypothetical protein